ncbi:hypothetical protein SEUBUCD646_0B02850 [Saccharomyces eubayanus]|uniref:Pre-mRNA-splicing factor CWC15 n=2 Tax=Saccharomyces TaxID=4930 RepID=A0A6C1E439_SACPS|nr:hypothetical protein GRS66_005962 [Saccharomyces pastorianus]CAI1828894.1 hypothetical protein SEUBUCD650_0B02860 [Saccharomyces eubayanus]CAI1864073.1 hypothetical protein SEUBUCD646_0B02850 [Saccharomyces eubayanus]
MTTSHRPQLEARSGAKAAAYTPTSIEHARLLPGHTKLKYRKFKQDIKCKESCSQGEGSSDGSVDERQINEDEQDDVEDENLEESEDDQEDLLKELAKIQEAKLDKKIRLQQKEKIEEQPSKRSWRQSTAFGRHKITKITNSNDDGAKNPLSGYVNDMTKSKYHQEFLHKNIK